MSIKIAICLFVAAFFNSGLVAGEIEFCADLASNQISLGEQTALVAVIWNRSGGEVNYLLGIETPKPRFSEYPAASSIPDVRTIRGHSVDIRILKVPVETLFDATSTGEYQIDVEFSASDNAPQIGGTSQLVLAVGETELKGGFFVKSESVQVHGEPLEAFSLDDSAHREQRKQKYLEIMGWRDPEDQTGYFSGLREWYSTPEGHYGFGEPEDWIHERDGSNAFALVRNLECLLDGAYCLSETEYFERYVAQYEARLRFGISPYYEIKQVVQILRESGKQASLTYLSNLDTSDWHCYEKILLSFISNRIRLAIIPELPIGLVYSPEVAPLKRGEDGRLYRLEQ